MPASGFVYQKKELDADTLADYQTLCDFVDGFVPWMLIDKDNNHMIGKDGQIMTAKRFIDTKSLLACSTHAEA
jgi:hypothetical protein